MNFLFVNPPLRLSAHFVDYPYFANLGIYHNASVLSRAGHHVRVVDAFALPCSRVERQTGGVFLGCGPAELLGYATSRRSAPEWVVVQNSPFLRPRRADDLLSETLAEIRRAFPASRIALADLYLGGMHYSDYDAARARSTHPEVDCVLKYEAESKWELLTRANGLGAASGDFLEQPVPADLSSLPRPAWDLIDVDRYFSFLVQVFSVLDLRPGFSIRERTLPLVTSRGCVFDCIFCSSHPGARTRNSYRTHPFSYVSDLVGHLTERYRVQKLVILDGMVNLERERFGALLELLNGHNLRYELPNGIRADRATREHISMMKGRISSLAVSAESGSEEILEEVVRKKQSLTSVEEVARWCHEMDVPLTIHYVIGFPGERVRNVNETLAHAARMADEYGAKPSVQYAVPLPGTPLASVARERGLWSEDPGEDYFEHFSRTPAMSTGPCTGETLRKMKELFESRSSTAGPRKIILNVTYRCNNRCTFCAVGDRPARDGEFDAHLRVVEQGRREGISLLDLDGGEPTVHPRLLDLISAARRLGYEKVNVTTNGRRLSYEHFARALLGSGITGLLVSLHGPTAEIHEQLTATPGSFEQTVAGIRNVLRFKPAGFEFGINTTLNRSNLPFVGDLIEFALGLGMERMALQLVTPFGRATASMAPDPADVRDLLPPLMSRHGSRLELAVINAPPCCVPGYEGCTIDDFLKQERDMVFLGPERVNLHDYLSARRHHKAECIDCPYYVACPGFWEWEQQRETRPVSVAELGVSKA